MSISVIVDALLAAGATAEQIAAAVKAHESVRLAQDEERRRKAREKKRRQRAAVPTCPELSPGQTGTDRDNSGQTGTTPSPSPSPFPPRDIINPPIPSPIPSPSSSSLRSDEETRDKRACAAKQSAEDFDRFWMIWPNKVGKPAAAKAFFKVRGEAEAIIAGVPRYVAETERLGRPWLNPATFLNQRRWEDSPAMTATPQARAGPATGRRNPFFEAYENLCREGYFGENQQPASATERFELLDLAPVAPAERRGNG